MLFEGQNELWRLGNLLKLSVRLSFRGNGHSTNNSLNNLNNCVKISNFTTNHFPHKRFFRMTPFIKMIMLNLERQSVSVFNKYEGP
jgi:hypothetical protein